MGEPNANAYGRGQRIDTPPAAKQVRTPAGVQTVFMDDHPRCNGTYRGRPCHKLLAELVSRPWRIKCSRCGTTNVRNTPAPNLPFA